MTINEITAEAKRRLSPQRFEHSRRVAVLAIYIARLVGDPSEKAKIAGLLHDIAREFSLEQLKAAAEKYRVTLTRFNLTFIPSIHGKVGAAIAEQEFDIHDEEILNAIRNHVTGRPCMKPLEQILYAADHLSKMKKPTARDYDDFRTDSLEKSLCRIMKRVIEYDVKAGKTIDERTTQTFDWLLEVANQKHSPDKTLDVSDFALSQYDAKFDALIEVYTRQKIPCKSIENIRSFYGYMDSGNRMILKNNIIRSADLRAASKEDLDYLRGLGINYIIDLRSDYERSTAPDVLLPGFQYLSVPLTQQRDPSYLDRLIEWFQNCNDAEEATWLSAHYFDSLNIDEMYASIFSDQTLEEKINAILRIMLREDCTGILFHCTSGKDRTGIVSCFILNLLGVQDDVIKDDYLASQVPYYFKTLQFISLLREKRYSPQTQKKVVSVFSVEESRFQKMQDAVSSKTSTYKQFATKKIHLSPEEIEGFRNKFLDITAQR